MGNDIEYRKDYDAFLKLYEELIDRYDAHEENDFFASKHIGEYSDIGRFIKIWDKVEIFRMGRGIMDHGISKLLNMENDLNQL